MNENETFVDVGANLGLFVEDCERLQKQGSESRSNRAYPENFNALCRNIRINNFRNVKTINKAASDYKG